MSKILKEAMLDRMVKLSASIAALNTAADQLAKSAGQCEGKPMPGAMIDIARRQRVKVLEMQGQLAALNVTFTERFGVDL